MRVKLGSVDEELQRLALQTQHLIELRNKVDRLERAAEGARRILPSASFGNADKLSIADAEARIADLREALRRSKREEAPFFLRLFWTFLKDSRNHQLLSSVGNLDRTLARQGFERGQRFLPERSLAAGVEFVEALKAASASHPVARSVGLRASWSPRQKALASCSGLEPFTPHDLRGTASNPGSTTPTSRTRTARPRPSRRRGRRLLARRRDVTQWHNRRFAVHKAGLEKPYPKALIFSMDAACSSAQKFLPWSRHPKP
jgi:hypothetical protein